MLSIAQNKVGRLVDNLTGLSLGNYYIDHELLYAAYKLLHLFIQVKILWLLLMIYPGVLRGIVDTITFLLCNYPNRAITLHSLYFTPVYLATPYLTSLICVDNSISLLFTISFRFHWAPEFHTPCFFSSIQYTRYIGLT